MTTASQVSELMTTLLNMPAYCVSVELHDIGREDPAYRVLRTAMEQGGFYRELNVLTGGMTFGGELPHATFWKRSNKDTSAVDGDARGIVRALHPRGATVLTVKVADARLNDDPREGFAEGAVQSPA
jgi:hypothetical protein